MEFKQEQQKSRKRKDRDVKSEDSNNKLCCGMIKPAKRVVWDIFIQEPCIIEYPFFKWNFPMFSSDSLYEQTINYYGLFRVMGQCKVFKKTYPKLSAYNNIWHMLWNNNYVLTLYINRKKFINVNVFTMTQFIERDIIFALKHLVLTTQRKHFCNKKKAIAMLEL